MYIFVNTFSIQATTLKATFNRFYVAEKSVKNTEVLGQFGEEHDCGIACLRRGNDSCKLFYTAENRVCYGSDLVSGVKMSLTKKLESVAKGVWASTYAPDLGRHMLFLDASYVGGIKDFGYSPLKRLKYKPWSISQSFGFLWKKEGIFIACPLETRSSDHNICQGLPVGDADGTATEMFTDSLLPYKHGGAAGVVLDENSMWLTGGSTTVPVAKTSLFRDGVWSEGPDLPQPLAYHCATQINATWTFVIGGMPSFNIPTQETWMFDWNTHAWTSKAPLPFTSVYAACGTMINQDTGDQLVLLSGGCQDNYDTSSAHTEVYNVETDSWSEGKDLGEPVMNGVMYNIKGKLYHFGNNNIQPAYSVQKYHLVLGWMNTTDFGYIVKLYKPVVIPYNFANDVKP